MDKNKEMCNVPDDILKRLQEDVSAIKVALLGNEYNPAGGLLCRTTDLEQQVEKLRVRYDKMMWTASGAAAVIAIIANLLVKLFDKIIT